MNKGKVKTKIKINRPLGTRDIVPPASVTWSYVIDKIESIFRSYGYQRIITPIIEKFELFALRSGEEIRNRMFLIETPEEELVLRPEITASVCRVIASGQLTNMPLPYKFYYIDRCYRYERPQAGRYREFWQAGMELMGSSSPLADAEIIIIASNILNQLGIHNFKLHIGHLAILRGYMEDKKLTLDEQNAIIGQLDALGSDVSKLRLYINSIKKSKGAVDKTMLVDIARKVIDMETFKEDFRDKLAREGKKDLLKELELDSERKYWIYEIAETGKVAESDIPKIIELLEDKIKDFVRIQKLIWSEVGISVTIENEIRTIKVPLEIAEKLVSLIDLVGDREEVISAGKKLFSASSKALKAFEDFEVILDTLDELNIPYITDLSIARGLDYYTGMVFEIYIMELGAQKQVCGGGRYDNLVSDFGGPNLPAVGFAMGLDRIILAMDVLNVAIPPLPRADVYIIPLDTSLVKTAQEIAERLRQENINTELNLMSSKLKKALSLASKLNVRFSIILGKAEAAENKLVVKDMVKEEQEVIPISEVVSRIKAGLGKGDKK